MNPAVTAFVDTLRSSASWASIAGLLLQATAVGLLGHLALLLARPASAASRHVIALSALASLLVLPALSWAPKPWASWSLDASWVPGTRVAVQSLEHGSDMASSPSDASSWTESSGPAAPTSEDPPVAPVAAPPLVSVVRENAPAALAALAWGVAGWMLARIALGLMAAAWAVRRATPASDPGLERELAAARERLGITRRVALATSTLLSVPIVSGIARPVLVLPADASSWTVERVRAVFLHELAHVRRGDAVGLMVARLATAVFWFHPLAWSLARAMRRECERACDDVVLSSGLRASDYADHLLAIARAAAGRPVPGLTLAFARTSSLEGRLLTLLRSDLRRGPASARLRLAVALIALLVLLPLSAMRVVGAAAETPEMVTDGASTAPSVVTETAQRSGEVQESWKKQTDQKESWKKEWKQDWKQEEKTGSSDDSSVDPEPTDAETAEGSSPQALYSRAKEMYEAQRYAEAGPAYEAAARGRYRLATAWYNAACSYALAQQKLPALGALQRAIAAGYNDVGHMQQDEDLNFIRGDGRFQLMIEDLRNSDDGQRQRDRAVEKYKALSRSLSEDAGDWNSTGIELMRAGETELAIKAFQRRVGIDGSPSGIYNQACAEALDGQTNAALQTLERAIDSGFGDKDKVRSDADLTSLHGRPEFQRLVQLADDLTIRHQGLDDRDRDAWRDVVPRYERVAREHGDLGRAWFNLGYVQLRAGDPAAGRESFERALNKSYRRGTTLYNLACAAAQLDDREAALRWLAQAETAGMDVLGNAKNDDDLAPLRSDQRFRSMMDRLERSRYDQKWKGNKKS